MNATYTIRYAYPAAAHTGAALTREFGAAVATAAMILAAPVLGLVFVVTLPIAGLACIAWMAAKALVSKRAVIAAVAKRTALFFAAPMVGLAYLMAFPFVAMGMLVYYGARAARS